MDNINLWNQRDLEPPAFSVYQSDNCKIDNKKLRRVCEHAKDTFLALKKLNLEAALLSRCIYRLKYKLRSDRGFKAMEKTNHALRQYLNMNYAKAIDDFLVMMPRKYENVTYFPSRNNLDYLIVRTQGLAKLLCRIAECSKTAAHYLHYRMVVGQLWKPALITFAINARIFTIVKYLTKYICEFYHNLLEQRMKFKNIAPNWLVDDYNFPSDLKTWIDADWLDFDILKKEKIDSDVIFCGEYYDLDADEFMDEYINISDENKTDIIEIDDDLVAIKNTVMDINKKLDDQLQNELFVVDDDVGEVITDIPRTSGVNKSVKKNNKNDSIVVCTNNNVKKLNKKGDKHKNKLFVVDDDSKAKKHLKENNKTNPVKISDSIEFKLVPTNKNVKNLNKKGDELKKKKSYSTWKELQEKLKSISTLKGLVRFHTSDYMMKEKYPAKWKQINTQIKTIMKLSFKKQNSSPDLDSAKKIFKMYFTS